MFDCNRFAWRRVGLTGALVAGLFAGGAVFAQQAAAPAAQPAASGAAVSAASGKKMTKAAVPEVKAAGGTSGKGDDCSNVAGAPKPKLPKCPQDVAGKVKAGAGAKAQ